MFAMESASAPSVGFELLLLCCERVQAVEIIKQGELGFSAQISGGAEQAIRLEPEIVRSEVINRRIYKQNLRHHNLYIHLLARSVYPPGVYIILEYFADARFLFLIDRAIKGIKNP